MIAANFARMACRVAAFLAIGRADAGDPAGEPAAIERGRALFAEAGGLGCARCHRIKGEGGDLGPDLSAIGAKFDRAQLVESIREPSRQIVEGYRPEVVALTDGRVLTGLVRGEAPESFRLLEGDGAGRLVLRSEVEERRPSEVSIMPSGLADRLGTEDFDALVAYLGSLRPPAGEVLPPGFSTRTVASGFTGATAMEVGPDGRVFLCEQTGAIRVVKGDALLPEPLVTLAVDSRWERGLLGVALPADFGSTGHLFACYVAAEPFPHHRISRFTVRGDVAIPGSEVILFEGDDQRKLGGSVPEGHQGGAIHFGADGKLYVAIGDQTAGAPAQAMDSLLGKLLRINPDGSIPEDNPFAASARGKYRAIWALGLRNPFTFAVQPGSGRIYLNDVGGIAEEVDEGFAGANYGWPTVEQGPTSDPRFRGAIHSYPTASITGGAFCPADSPFPAASRGKYFFMDFVRGWINVLDPDRPATASPFASGLARPVDLKFAPDGSLYVLVRDAWVKDREFRPHTGSLRKILPPSP